jgi:hypothetical protein
MYPKLVNGVTTIHREHTNPWILPVSLSRETEGSIAASFSGEAGPNTPMVAGLSLCDKVGARLQVHNCKLQSTSSPRPVLAGPGWAVRDALETAGNEGRLPSVAVVYAHSA